MSTIESLTVSLFCIALVFFVLSCLFTLVKVLSKVLSRIEDKRAGISIAKAADETAVTKTVGEANANGISTGELKLINVDEKTAAMIMAIVSHESKVSLWELSFKSIKAVEES